MYQKSYIVVKVLIRKKNTFLILKTMESNQNDELVGWETPGGKLEAREDVIDGLKREVLEETGLRINLLSPFNVYSGYSFSFDKDTNVIGINFLAEYLEGEVVIDPHEHTHYQWITVDQIRTLRKSLGLQKEIDAYEQFINKYKINI